MSINFSAIGIAKSPGTAVIAADIAVDEAVKAKMLFLFSSKVSIKNVSKKLVDVKVWKKENWNKRKKY